VLPLLWEVAGQFGVNATGMAMLVAKETNWATFLTAEGKPGNVSALFNNFGGLKVSPAQQRLFLGVTDDDNPLAHALFPSIEAGLIAVAEHLRAHCGMAPVGVLRDYRYQLVLDLHGLDPAVRFSDLNGRWAPSETYGDDLEAMIVTYGTP